MNYNKIGAADVMISETAKNSKNDIFRSKQTTNKVLAKIIRFRSKKKGMIDVFKAKGYH